MFVVLALVVLDGPQRHAFTDVHRPIYYGRDVAAALEWAAEVRGRSSSCGRRSPHWGVGGRGRRGGSFHRPICGIHARRIRRLSDLGHAPLTVPGVTELRLEEPPGSEDRPRGFLFPVCSV